LRHLALFAAGTAFAQTPYLDYPMLEKRIAALSGAKVVAIGNSAGGRTIHAVEIGSGKQGVFVGANIAGFHNAGTQAALHLIDRLLKDPKLAEGKTYYIVPSLNPDAHDGMFGKARYRRANNGGALDKDRDGLVGEDGPNDLNNDGRITQMRIADPAGDMIADSANPNAMIKADPTKGQRGTHRVVLEGFDDDKDGQFNEDPPGGERPDKNFAHGWSENDPESGAFPSSTPEAKAAMDYLLARRNVAIAFVFGPANNLLALPRGSGAPVGDVGSQRVTVPPQFAGFLGLEANKQYTIDEIWDIVKDSAQVRAQGLNKEQLAQFLGGGAATQPDSDDLKLYEKLAESYKKSLEKAGLDSKRAGAQSPGGGFQNWLYYHYGVFAVELDVWGPSSAKPAASGAAPSKLTEAPITIERLEKMSNDEFLAIGEERIAAYLKEIKAPAQVTAKMLIDNVKSGRITPARMAGMMKQMNLQAPAAPPPPDLPGGYMAWVPVTLPDGTKAEVGGLDPFAEIAPPEAELTKAAEAHLETILEAASQLARVEIVETKAEAIGEGVWRIKAKAINTQPMPTHTKHGARTRNWLPVRLTIELPAGVTPLPAARAATSERLAMGQGALEATWMIRAKKGTRIAIDLLTSNAGTDRKEIVLQ
jgi:hypothetical protein